MGIGYCCCGGGKNFPTSFGYEYGRSSASVNEYFRFGLLTGRLKESVQVISDKQFPNFVYDIQVLYNTDEQGLPNDKLYVASGDHGVVEYSINQYIQNQTNIYLEGENDETTFTGLLGEIWRGDGLGSRYGYENFSGAYGLAIYNNKYILVAHGVNGLSVINSETGESFNGIFSEENTIFNEVHVSRGNVFLGTSKYDWPLLEYYYEEDQEWYQPEFDYLDPSIYLTKFNSNYGGQDLINNGVYAFNIENLFKSQGIIDLQEGEEVGQSFLFNCPTTYSVNRIKSAGSGSVYVATGQREEDTYGGYPDEKTQQEDGKILKITPNNETEDGYESETIDSGNAFIDMDVHAGDLYYLVSNYNNPFIKKYSEGVSSNFLDLKNQTSKTFCTDPSLNCQQFDPGSASFVDVDSGLGVVVNSQNDPDERLVGQICNQIEHPFGTPEMMGSMPNGIKVTSEYIYVSFWQNGYAIYDTNTTSLIEHYDSHFDINCDDFTHLSSGATDVDYNPEYTISCGRIIPYNNFSTGSTDIFIANSIQFVANGAGPGVYDPTRTQNDANRFVSILRGFEIFSGIIALTS